MTDSATRATKATAAHSSRRKPPFSGRSTIPFHPLSRNRVDLWFAEREAHAKMEDRRSRVTGVAAYSC
jgi:hypothetical protein